jgi:predicted nucleotidyltransferase
MVVDTIDLTPPYQEQVSEILQRHLRDTGAKVYLFGSRAKGKALKYSDVDLAVDMPNGLPLELHRCLRSAFEESLLPYHVDVIDYRSLTPIFKQNIDTHKVLIYEDAP